MQLSFWHTTTGAVSFIPAVSGGTPAPLYTNPGGTGDRTSTVTVTTGNMDITSGVASNLVDGAVGDNSSDSVNFPYQSTYGGWIQFEFDEPKFISEATFKANNSRYFGNWRWQASNDGVGWTDVTFIVEIEGPTQVIPFNTPSPNGYTYYRMSHVSSDFGHSSLWVREIEFKIDTGTALDISTTPSYGNPGGVGDRTGIITATSNWVDQGLGGDIQHSVNGIIASQDAANSWYFEAGGNTGGFVKWEFDGPKHITEITYYKNNSDNHGDWKLQGSTDDVNWTDVSSTFTLDLGKKFINLDLISPGDKYTYYRMLGMGGYLSSKQWQYEVEFKLSV